MVSLASLLNLVAEQHHTADLVPHRCLRKRLNTNNCSRCLDSCSSGALSLRGREIVLDKTCCTGCMTCVAVCPQDALTSKFDAEGLLAYLDQKTNVQISCDRQRRYHPDEIIVPCVGVLSKPILAAMGLVASGSVIFNLAGCIECPNRQSSEFFKKDINEVVGVLSDSMQSELIISETNKQAELIEADRRSYLTNLKNTFSKASKNHPVFEVKSIEPEPMSSRRVPEKTRLVQNIIRGLDVASRKRILSLFGNNLSVNQECTCCPLCKGICPTGAIKIERSEQGKKLKFQMLDCSGCGICVEFCRKDALSLENGFSGDPGITTQIE
jgi:formate hydrogenlyase subunit 6/NADH:ubiquinone oxidoreductase subunit I